jgi:TRAP-type C4-dicarboxylate transport system permease small subunit
MRRKKVHKPNHIPEGERQMNIVFSVFLFAYGSYGVWVNDLYVPGRRSPGIHLSDVPAWIMYSAIICACLVMLSVVVDHYDRRDNERHYRQFALTFKYVGWGLFGLSLFMAIVR